MKKPTPTTDAVEPGVMPDTRFAEKFPLLSAHLADDRWEDGTDRQVSTLTFKVEGGALVGALNDREGRQSLYRTAETMEGVSKALEKALGDPKADWRPWGGNKKSKGKGA